MKIVYVSTTSEFNKRPAQMSNKNPVGYVDKRVLMEFIQEHMPDGKYIRIGMDHPGCWVDDEPYNHLIPLYTEPMDMIEVHQYAGNTPNPHWSDIPKEAYDEYTSRGGWLTRIVYKQLT